MTVGLMLSVTLGLTIANYAWQYFQPIPLYSTAFDRSYFQFWAILVSWLIEAFK